MFKPLIAALAVGLAAPASAEVDLTAVTACIDSARTDGTNPNLCVDTAHQDCLVDSAEAPAAATLCFTKAREAWSQGIAARMETIRANAPEKLAALAGIEVKYDLISSLTQCDRLEELGQLQEAEAETILLQKTRCTATASGLAYTRLLWRLPNPDTQDK
ncbi:hypothetical protein [Tropicibacter naphthalenivorans]|uniref:Lysozyme inhibitor LprI N-terminal domain-containing protein n=1 Tax=Tropicibacter naphthalenivorans TaxID=441103 RepID=A0A0N7LYW4_9RHOB|nr:hypothetical protein [Tropicibacter naphthalenivorans]CUH75993.1 hypothetical protein TRN7648_00728 [Tropicibacter naphthalenivorans]SMC40707.1 hypothetical protein SAMN04488093_101156 [Tropicibacter naphthalenivorans]